MVKSAAVSSTVIAGQEALDNFRRTFRPKQIIKNTSQPAEICLLLPFGTERLGEIATAISAQLTLNRISLAGILVCPPEDIVIVPEIDAPRTFEALQQLQREEGKSNTRKVRGLKQAYGSPK